MHALGVATNGIHVYPSCEFRDVGNIIVQLMTDDHSRRDAKGDVEDTMTSLAGMSSSCSFSPFTWCHKMDI